MLFAIVWCLRPSHDSEVSHSPPESHHRRISLTSKLLFSAQSCHHTTARVIPTGHVAHAPIHPAVSARLAVL